MISTDFLIVGAGIIGISLALEIKRRFPKNKVTIIEKEADCGYHASGRNSGVLHAGFYYSADSLKARFTREGNELLTEYCLRKGLAINRCGKLVVARNEQDLAGLDELLRRAAINNVELADISASEAKEIEPRVKTFKRALFSPTTASVNPREVMAALVNDALQAKIRIENNTAYLSSKQNRITTTSGIFHTNYLINAGGLYADQIAHSYGVAKDYQILPFKGIYLVGKNMTTPLRTHITPVPDLNTPFLGVHITLGTDGNIKLGPTAMPAFWREQYQGLERFSLKECSDILNRTRSLFFNNHANFRTQALGEFRKYRKSNVIKFASQLADGLDPKDYLCRGKSGIRAQLVDINSKQLEHDFLCIPGIKSMHILNAVSPGFTCAFPFASYVIDKVVMQLDNKSNS